MAVLEMQKVWWTYLSVTIHILHTLRGYWGISFMARFQSTITNSCVFKCVTFYKTAELLRSLSVEFCSDPRTVVLLQLKPRPALLPQPHLMHHLLPFTTNLSIIKALVVIWGALLKRKSYWTEPSFLIIL